jgi:hypothetical protein
MKKSISFPDMEMYDENVEKRHSADLLGLADWKMLKQKKTRRGCMKQKERLER